VAGEKFSPGCGSNIFLELKNTVARDINSFRSIVAFFFFARRNQLQHCCNGVGLALLHFVHTSIIAPAFVGILLHFLTIVTAALFFYFVLLTLG